MPGSSNPNGEAHTAKQPLEAADYMRYFGAAEDAEPEEAQALLEAIDAEGGEDRFARTALDMRIGGASYRRIGELIGITSAGAAARLKKFMRRAYCRMRWRNEPRQACWSDGLTEASVGILQRAGIASVEDVGLLLGDVELLPSRRVKNPFRESARRRNATPPASIPLVVVNEVRALHGVTHVSATTEAEVAAAVAVGISEGLIPKDRKEEWRGVVRRMLDVVSNQP